MHAQRVIARFGLAMLVIGLASCTETGESAGSHPPHGTQSLASPVPDNSVYLFDAPNFDGNVTRLENVLATPAGATRDIAAFGQSSARWNLPPGVVVMLYSDPGGRGNELALWGRGQMPSLDVAHMNNNVRQWAWYSPGGTSAPALTAAASVTPRPPGASPTTSVPNGTIELYRDQDLAGRLTTIGPVSNVAVGTPQPVGAATDHMSSLRWNLPPGMIAVLYENPDGTGRQVVLWGDGQYMSLAPMAFNDRVTSWAWYDIASAGSPTVK